jgi:hypothetical protein
MIVGLRQVHKTDTWRSVLAVLTPTAVFCVLELLLWNTNSS